MSLITENNIYKYKAIGINHVLAVAVINRYIKDFTVYIDAVPGINHKEEFMEVSKRGGKIDRKTAELWFPSLFKEYKWRD